MPPADDERLDEVRRGLAEISAGLNAISRRIEQTIRESDRRAEEYLPILRRAGLVPGPPPLPRRRWWQW